MRPTTSTRPLLMAAATLAAACEDSSSPFEPPAAPVSEAPVGLPALADQHWAAGYAFADKPTTASYTPVLEQSYNRSGGRITIQRPATGRYVVTFAGLSAALGPKSTVHVTSHSAWVHCKPMNGALVGDKVEVRCLDISSGSPANTTFGIVVLGKAAGRAFAFAHKPTSASYAPAGSGSHNPAGTMRIVRLSTGNYQVLFNNLGSQLQSRAGHVQVNAVAGGKAWCKAAEEWGGNPHLSVLVQCYTTGGLPADAKFTVLFQLPAPHLAYAYANQPSLSSYTIGPFWSSNPAGGQVTVSRFNRGDYTVTWTGADAQILGLGNAQVTAVGTYDNASCTLTRRTVESASVYCFAANRAPVDVPFSVLLGS
jgi:hypothetical protein